MEVGDRQREEAIEGGDRGWSYATINLEYLGLPDAGRGKERSFRRGLGGSMAMKTT